MNTLKELFFAASWLNIASVAVLVFAVFHYARVHGWPWVVGKATSIANSVKGFFTVAKADVTFLAARIGSLEARMGSLEAEALVLKGSIHAILNQAPSPPPPTAPAA